MSESGMAVPLESKQKYLSRRLGELAKIQEMIHTPDWEFVAKVGHQIKGNAKTFEFPSLSDLGSRLEEAGKTKDSRLLKDVCAELLASLESLNQNLTSSV
ncbi:Hpt domain-containing protein [Bdellovibrio bacteriovorus]|uniref:Hpt domain-containing protein n=1 Tax=Bdellovibrio bacteriovorus TaxID=959 RepID=UPI0035A73A60